MVTLGGVTIDHVQSERINRQSNLLIFTLPGSATPFVFDFMGAQTTVTISGQRVDSAANIQAFCDSLTGLVNGAQDSISYTPVSISAGALTVYVDSVEISMDKADFKTGASGSCIANYTVNLVVSQ